MTNPILTPYIIRHEAVLKTLIEQADIPATRIKEAILYALCSGGKRLRPLLVYLTGELLDINPAALDIIAAAIELMHAYSLVHDDLPSIDNDDMRRGKPSCHRAFDEATAILTGDALQALSITCLLTHLPHYLTPTHVIAIATTLITASGPAGMISGQSLDLTELAKTTIDVSQLTRIHQLKTGCLFSSCITMVLQAGNPSEKTRSILNTIGSHVGLVFQMQDDYLDHYGAIERLGKNRASDQANDKLTFARLYSQEQLATVIAMQFQQINELLDALGPEAMPLSSLINTIQQRGETSQ